MGWMEDADVLGLGGVKGGEIAAVGGAKGQI
jgi:hypothetical protein